MRKALLQTIALAGAVVLGACRTASDGGAFVKNPPPGADPDAAGIAADDQRPYSPPGRGEAGAATPTTRRGTDAPTRPGGSSGSTAPSPSGSKEQPPQALPDEGQDTFDRRAHLPPGAVRVVSGRNATAEWRLYAYREGGDTCVQFASQSSASGGAGGTCDQEPPLDKSGSESDHGRFVYGLTAGKVAKVRVEHKDGTRAVFDTAGAASYSERFYAGEVSWTPIERIVGLDSSGKVVAERTDMGGLNM